MFEKYRLARPKHVWKWIKVDKSGFYGPNLFSQVVASSLFPHALMDMSGRKKKEKTKEKAKGNSNLTVLENGQ